MNTDRFQQLNAETAKARSVRSDLHKSLDIHYHTKLHGPNER